MRRREDIVEREKKDYGSIDEYIRSFPRHTRKMLVELKDLIREEAPEAEEKISYRMPAFSLNGILLYFAAYSKHIGFYPTASGVRAFENTLSKYKHAKGSIQFPIDEPLPVELIRRIVSFRVKENMKKK